MKGRFKKKKYTPPLEKNIQRFGVRYSYKCFKLPFDSMLMICSSSLQDQSKDDDFTKTINCVVS